MKNVEMYIAITGSRNNKDVYIYQSFRKKDGKLSSRIYKKLGKYNTLLDQFDGDNEKLMAWAKSEAACIPMNEARSFDFTGFTTVFLLSNCQRWDYIIEKIFCINKSRMRLEPCELGKEWL